MRYLLHNHLNLLCAFFLTCCTSTDITTIAVAPKYKQTKFDSQDTENLKRSVAAVAAEFGMTRVGSDSEPVNVYYVTNHDEFLNSRQVLVIYRKSLNENLLLSNTSMDISIYIARDYNNRDLGIEVSSSIVGPETRPQAAIFKRLIKVLKMQFDEKRIISKKDKFVDIEF